MANPIAISDDLAKSFTSFSDAGTPSPRPWQERVYDELVVFLTLPVGEDAREVNHGLDGRALKLLNDVVDAFSRHGLSADTPEPSDIEFKSSRRGETASCEGVLRFADTSLKAIDAAAGAISREIYALKSEPDSPTQPQDDVTNVAAPPGRRSAAATSIKQFRQV